MALVFWSRFCFGGFPCCCLMWPFEETGISGELDAPTFAWFMCHVASVETNYGTLTRWVSV